MLLIEDPRYQGIKRDAAHYERVTGEQGLLYPSSPGGGGEPTRFVFGRHVALGMQAAQTYAKGLALLAREQEEKEAAARRAAEIAEEMKDWQ
ncbi:hypothetical protein AB0M39_41880 [Streptomyces sp. NPDC051907]|uniref:hypothetical protein n=1 Tax=Streptomyces sp. NPDC051907 TaxID=3155284 RepID=UPI00342642C0